MKYLIEDFNISEWLYRKSPNVTSVGDIAYLEGGSIVKVIQVHPYVSVEKLRVKDYNEFDGAAL